MPDVRGFVEGCRELGEEHADRWLFTAVITAPIVVASLLLQPTVPLPVAFPATAIAWIGLLYFIGKYNEARHL